MSPSAPERILILSTWSSLYPLIGGGGTPIEGDMFEAFLGAGYEIDLVAPASSGPSDFPEGPRFRVHRIGEQRLGGGSRARRSLAMRELTARLVGRGLAAARGGPRPAVVYGLGAPAVRAAAWTGRALRRPSVGVIYGTFLAPILGDRDALRARFEDVAAFRAPVTRLSVLDDGTRGDEVAAALGVPSDRVLFRRHGVDRAACEAAPVADRAALGIPEGAPLIASASRLAGWKRVDRVIRAMPGVLERHPDAVLAVAGDGPSGPELRSLAAELGVADSVVFTGPLDRETTLGLMKACDVFCSFYDFSNVGLALLEAMTIGVAVVVADTGSTAELVEDGAGGLVVEPDDERAAAAAISSLLADPDLRARLGEGASARARELVPGVEERMAQELELVRELSA
jgi:phosphatidylinositol alpha-1,6-mannosyltransferase